MLRHADGKLGNRWRLEQQSYGKIPAKGLTDLTHELHGEE
jgi:hypothetical protein